MNCTRYERWMWDALEGRLGESQAQALQAHLRQCPRCQRQWESAQATYHALHALPRLRAPEQLMHQVRARIQHAPARPPLFGGWKRVALAPALGLLIVLGYWAFTVRTPDATQTIVQEPSESWVEMHEQLEVADWSPTPTANYFITTGYSR